MMILLLLFILPSLPWTACLTATITPEDDTESVPPETTIEMIKDIVSTVMTKDNKFSAEPGWEKCPYPPEDTIDPCKCFGNDLCFIENHLSMVQHVQTNDIISVDEHFRIHLHCQLDVSVSIIHACQKIIELFR